MFPTLETFVELGGRSVGLIEHPSVVAVHRPLWRAGLVSPLVDRFAMGKFCETLMHDLSVAKGMNGPVGTGISGLVK